MADRKTIAPINKWLIKDLQQDYCEVIWHFQDQEHPLNKLKYQRQKDKKINGKINICYEQPKVPALIARNQKQNKKQIGL